MDTHTIFPVYSCSLAEGSIQNIGESECSPIGYQSAEDYYFTTGYRAGHATPHRVGIIESGETANNGDTRPHSQTDPLPIGDGFPLLLLLSLVYLLRSVGGISVLGRRGRL